jgi:cytochrome c556
MEDPIMTRAPYRLLLAALAVGLFVLAGDAADPKKPSKLETLMKKKLLQSEKVLGGIALQDFDKIEKHAGELVEISKEAEWKVMKTPLYQMYLNEFRQNADDLLAAAKKRNIDGAALAYVNMTLTCVKCHKHVREKRMVRGE